MCTTGTRREEGCAQREQRREENVHNGKQRREENVHNSEQEEGHHSGKEGMCTMVIRR